MIRRFLPLLLAVACTAAPPADRTAIPLRNPTAPVASQANATADRLAGSWVVVQGAGVAPGTVVEVSDAGLSVGGVAYALVAPGRFERGEGRLWVHWLDIGNRTAALGDPAGGQVWIMDRTRASSPDRLTAAREILDWYGYDLRQLQAMI
ncbi:lipocalin [Thalassococcus sp. BH17M4-6]|uniref:lipocalin n=1 Tax=Thalassococcus sp. BH17M4-6 TaxID=3413148 RepID=UPI003BE1B4A9